MRVQSVWPAAGDGAARQTSVNSRLTPAHSGASRTRTGLVPRRARRTAARRLKSQGPAPAEDLSTAPPAGSAWAFLLRERLQALPLARYNCYLQAGVAQSVEQLIRNEKVGCSNHLSGTNTDKDLLLSKTQQTLFIFQDVRPDVRRLSPPALNGDAAPQMSRAGAARDRFHQTDAGAQRAGVRPRFDRKAATRGDPPSFSIARLLPVALPQSPFVRRAFSPSLAGSRAGAGAAAGSLPFSRLAVRAWPMAAAQRDWTWTWT